MKITILSFLVVIIGCAGCSKKNNSQEQQSTYLYPPHANAQPKGLKASESDFAAHLSAQDEAPGTAQPHTEGEAYLKISDDSSQIYYTITLAQVDSVTAAQIHYAATAENGPAVVSLYPGPNAQEEAAPTPSGPVNGILKSAMINSSNLKGPFRQKQVIDLIHAMQHDSVYVQVNTKAHPYRDLRGQLKAHHK
jgi:hypothetical protein